MMLLWLPALRFENYGPTDIIELKEEHQGKLRIGFDGRMLAISTEDPFGCLTKNFFQIYEKAFYDGNGDDLIDTKKGGAGLGFFKIYIPACSYM